MKIFEMSGVGKKMKFFLNVRGGQKIKFFERSGVGKKMKII